MSQAPRCRCLSCRCELQSQARSEDDLVTTIRQDQARERGVQPSPRLLTIEDVARYLGVSERWIYEQVRSGRLPAMLIARSWRLRQAGLPQLVGW